MFLEIYTKVRISPKRHYNSLYEQIYEVVRQVPPGKVATYGQIAKIVGFCPPAWSAMPWLPCLTGWKCLGSGLSITREKLAPGLGETEPCDSVGFCEQKESGSIGKDVSILKKSAGPDQTNQIPHRRIHPCLYKA